MTSGTRQPAERPDHRRKWEEQRQAFRLQISGCSGCEARCPGGSDPAAARPLPKPPPLAGSGSPAAACQRPRSLHPPRPRHLNPSPTPEAPAACQAPGERASDPTASCLPNPALSPPPSPPFPGCHTPSASTGWDRVPPRLCAEVADRQGTRAGGGPGAPGWAGEGRRVGGIPQGSGGPCMSAPHRTAPQPLHSPRWSRGAAPGLSWPVRERVRKARRGDPP